ncbi:hypothetical protein RS030_4689 [Cryptosporidium xiaoi]|uniref:Uncharacterized protein n=1 Tax=Cryptosporidium xiaoi TaxID=659607 RepID=A0AAV9XUM1_9CRYT
MTIKSIKWKKYFHFCITVSIRLKELECKWRQPQSDISLINWYKKQVLGDGVECEEPSFEECHLMISKVIEDGLIQVAGSYQDPVDGMNIRLLRSNKLFFPEIWT